MIDIEEDTNKKYGLVPLDILEARSKNIITANDFVVYTAIATFTSKHNRAAWPGQNRIMTMTGCTQSTVSKAVTRLIAAGLLSTRKARKAGCKPMYVLLKHPIGDAAADDVEMSSIRKEKAREALAKTKANARAKAKAKADKENYWDTPRDLVDQLLNFDLF